MDLSRQVGRRVKALRVARGLSRAELAGRLKLSRMAVYNIECGAVGISTKRIESLARVLGVSVAEVLP